MTSADQLFDLFVAAKSQEDVLELFSSIKTQVGATPTPRSIDFYSHLKSSIQSWRAQSIWKILDERVNHPVYKNNTACQGKRLLTIGAGPVGLRMSIESAFLGGEAHVIEKRTSATRNNILHLWPFTIDDLRRLGAKKFFGQFCAGAIDHISIRQLQLILLKICLILGVNVHVGVEFRGIIEPSGDKKGASLGWGVNVVPHPATLPRWRWDSVVQASGRQHVLPLFQYREFRGQQAIGVTVNFVNRGTMEELTIEEISGIAFIYNQAFFNEMQTELGISLENIVYYKDETHYFVMSTKKQSLLHKKVLRKDYPTTTELLSPDNIDLNRAQQFAKEVAGFATNLPVLDFMTNHHGKADIAIFDFSAIKMAANSAMVLERQGVKLLMALVGDSLLEPFWPMGTGCARGFLSVLNTAWMFNSFFSGNSVYDVLRERESLFKLLPQSTPLKLNAKHDKYTIDPATRYNCWTVTTEKFEVFHLYNRDDTPIATKATSQSTSDVAKQPDGGGPGGRRRAREGRRKTIQITMNRSNSREGNEEPNDRSPTTPTLEHGSLLNWARESTCGYKGVRVTNLTTTWKSGLAFSALIHRFRPDLLNFTTVSNQSTEQILTKVFEVTECQLGIPSPFSAKELSSSSIPDRHKIVQFLTSLHAHFTSEATKSLQISPDMCYFCERHITPDELTSSNGIKFHSSCLKCEHCLDKISVNTLHFVDPKMAAEYAARRKPGYPDCTSGFYCQFHFREFFTAKSESLYPKSWLDKDSDSGPSSSNLDTGNSDTPNSDEGDNGAGHELRRAKSAASVRSLRDLFESISTGNLAETPPTSAPPSAPTSPILNRKLPSPNSGGRPYPFPKSKSFSGSLPGVRDHQNGGENVGSVPATPKSNKRKSGVAKKIERRQETEKKIAQDKLEAAKRVVEAQNKDTSEQQTNKQKKSNGEALNTVTSSYLHSDSVVLNSKKKSRFKLFKKKKKLSDHRPQSPILTTTSESNLDDTMSIVISNKSDTTGSTFLDSTEQESLSKDEFSRLKSKFDSEDLTSDQSSDPLYTIANPEFLERSPEKMETERSDSFIRNSFSRRTAPPKLNDSEEIVESSSCRRTTATHRQAVVLKTDSPEARSLLRSSLRGSKRSQTAALVKQNLHFKSEDNLSNSPVPSKVQIARASSQQALVTPLVSEAHVISKTVYSPKPKRAQKVKLDLDEAAAKDGVKVSEARVMQKKKCSPLSQKSKKLRLTQKGVNPLRLCSSSSDSDTPPARPELPKNIDLILGNGNFDSLTSDSLKSSSDCQSSKLTTSSSDDMKMDDSSSIPSSENNLSTITERNNVTENVTITNGTVSPDPQNTPKPSESSSVMTPKEAKSIQSSNYRTFMYAKKDQDRLSASSSIYRTPDSENSSGEQAYFTPNTTFTPNSSFTESKHSVRIPAKRPSDPVEGVAKRYSSDIDENILQKYLVGVERAKSGSLTESGKSDSVSDGKRGSEDSSNTISNIIARYRKTADTKTEREEVRAPSPKEKTKRATNQRSAAVPTSGEKAKKQTSAPNKARVMSNISSSFDKIVSKYYPRKESEKEPTSSYCRQASAPSPLLSTAEKRRLSRATPVTRQQSTPGDVAKTRTESRENAKQHKTTEDEISDVSKQPSRKSRDMTKLLLDNGKKLTEKVKSPSSPGGTKSNHVSSPSRALNPSHDSNTSSRDAISSSCDPLIKTRDKTRRGSTERDSGTLISRGKPPRTPSGDLTKMRSPLRDRKKNSSPVRSGSGDLSWSRDSSSGSRDSSGRRQSSSFNKSDVKHHPSTASRFYKRSSSSSDTSPPSKATPTHGIVAGATARRSSEDVTKGQNEVSKRFSSGSSTISRDSSTGKSDHRSPGAAVVGEKNGGKKQDKFVPTPEKYISNHQNPKNQTKSSKSITLDGNSRKESPAKSKTKIPNNQPTTFAATIKSSEKSREGKSRDIKPARDSNVSRASNGLPRDANPARAVSPDKLAPKEDLPASLWNKKDYSRYLQSLRYSSSVSVSRIDSMNVRDTAKAFQRKETDV